MDEHEKDRDLYWILGFGGIGIALMYLFEVPYREGWMYWVGIPAMTLAVMGLVAAGMWLFRRWRTG
jgi:hypothetical protein